MQLAIDIATFKGRDLVEIFSPEHLAMRTYFTVQMARQKKWAEEKSAQLFQRVMPSRRTCTRIFKPAFERDEQGELW